MTTPTPRYRLHHYPNIPCQPFEVEHHDLTVIVAVGKALADYDHFLLKFRHRRDFTNEFSIEEQDPDTDEWLELDEYEIHEKLDTKDTDE